MDHLCYVCLLFFMLLRTFIAALWSPAGKRLISWLLLVMFNCVFVIFQYGILGQVKYLTVSIPDLCRLSYLMMVMFLAQYPMESIFLNSYHLPEHLAILLTLTLVKKLLASLTRLSVS